MTAARPFGFWTATALVVGGMIGSGIFMLPSSVAPYGWTGSVAWLISIGGVLAIAYTLSRLVATMPLAGGAIAITGAVLGRLPGVLVGWSYWISVWAAVAAIAVAAVAYLSVFVPVLATRPLAGALAAAALIWLLTLLNLGGARLAGRFQVVTTLLKLIPLVAVIAILAGLALTGGATLPPWPAQGISLGGLTAPIALTLFPLVGFEAAAIAADRVRRPEVTIMRATMAGTALVGLLYVIVCSGIVLTLPAAEVAASPAPFALFVRTFWGAGPALAVALFAAIAAIGALNCWVLIQGEVPLGMARAGLLHPWFAQVDERAVPVRVLLLSSCLASGLVLATASQSLGSIFIIAALLTTSTTLWLYLALCLAALIRRVAMPAAAIGLLFSLWALWGVGPETSGFSLLLMLTALPVYALRGRRPAAEQPA